MSDILVLKIPCFREFLCYLAYYPSHMFHIITSYEKLEQKANYRL